VNRNVSSEKKPYNPTKELSRGLKVSLGLHVLLVAIFTVKGVFFPGSEPINYQSAIRVDMVGLPDKIDAEKPLPPKKQESKPEPKSEPAPKPAKTAKTKEPKAEPKAPKKDLEAVNLTKEKNKQKEALEKLKTMSALDEIKKEVESDKKKMAGMGKAKPEGTKIKGNVLAAGTELTGLNRLQHDNYLGDLDHQIKQNWVLPQWLSKKPFRAQVRLKIDEKGQILSREIVLSSGNSSYDDLALDTIDRSAPFPAPPEKFVSIVAVNGLLIGFPE
jgi:colicin import membrane protein